MGIRRGAARRELRHAKRALARAERGSQKYANQKGGGPQKGHKKAFRPPSRSRNDSVRRRHSPPHTTPARRLSALAARRRWWS